MESDTYKSIRSRSAAEIKIKGSRFLAEAVPVAREEDVARAVAAVKKREHSATHHCTAYRLGPNAEVYRYNDDGEPSGTAGPPMLRQLEGRALTNVLVVVTRYYGGTKLGMGGLARAYGDAAAAALDAADVVTEVIYRRFLVSFEYDDTSPAMRVIERSDARVVESVYAAKTDLTIDVRALRADAFVDAYVEALGDRGAIRELD